MDDGRSGGYLSMFRGIISVKPTDNFQQSLTGIPDISNDALAVFNTPNSNVGWPASSDDFNVGPVTREPHGSMGVDVNTRRRGSLGSILLPKSFTEMFTSNTSNLNIPDDEEPLPASYNRQARRSSLQTDIIPHTKDNQEKNLLSKDDINNNSINKWSLLRRNTMTTLDGIPENTNQMGITTTDIITNRQSVTQIQDKNNLALAPDPQNSFSAVDRRKSAPAADLSSAIQKFEGIYKQSNATKPADLNMEAMKKEANVSKTSSFNFSGAISRRFFQVSEKNMSRNKDVNMVAPTSW